MLTSLESRFAKTLGYTSDANEWNELAVKLQDRTRSMFVDGWFRDWRNNPVSPIVLPDYYDIMMLAPLAVNIATKDQISSVAKRLDYFVNNPQFWLEWPSFIFPFTEAGKFHTHHKNY
jgi:hypothetical protein